MTDTLRLKGKAENGKTVEFGVKDILSVRVSHKRNGPNVAHIDPRTIQLADDPRKAMLDEIRKKFLNPVSALPDNMTLFTPQMVRSILDEMEVKL